MTAPVITSNDELASLSDRELLLVLLERTEAILHEMHVASDEAALTRKQLDHLDGMIHDQGQLLEPLRPLIPHIPRVLALLDPGAAMRKKWGKGKADGGT